LIGTYGGGTSNSLSGKKDLCIGLNFIFVILLNYWLSKNLQIEAHDINLGEIMFTIVSSSQIGFLTYHIHIMVGSA
jgi:hypothetical protein